MDAVSLSAETRAWLDLGAAQRAVWFDVQLGAPRSAYQLGIRADVEAALDEDLARRATVLLAARHEALRLRVDDALPRQWLEAAPEPPIVIVDLSNAPDPAVAFDAHVEEAIERGWTLGDAPLFRIDLVRRGPHATSVLLLCHHLIADAASVSIVLDQWLAVYASLAGETVTELPPSSRFVPLVEGDLAYEKSPKYAESLAYWTRRFADPPELLFGAVPGEPAARARPVRFALEDEAYARFAAACAQNGVTAQRALTALLAVALARRLHRSELTIGMALHRRDALNRSAIGMLAGVVAVRCSVERSAPLGRIVAGIGRALDDDLRHHRFPIDGLVRALERREPLFDVVVSFSPGAWDAGPKRLDGMPWRVEALRGAEMSALVMYVAERAGGDALDFEFAFDPARVAPDEAARIGRVFERCLATFARKATIRASAIDPLDEEERASIEGPWRGRTESYPLGTLPHLIALQTARTPTAVAVIGTSNSLTYDELGRRAGRLAARLAARGVGREDVVGVYLTRSVETVIAALGIMRAGGAYLPLDPAYPAARLEFMVRDAGAVLVLHGDGDDVWPFTGGVPLEELVREPLPGEELLVPPAGPDPNSLAYVIYTSGSSGEPKGVAVPHSAPVNLAYARLGHDPLGPGDRVLAAISVGFDVSIGQILLPLLVGATVVVAPDLRTLSAHDFWAFLVAHDVGHVNSVPSFFESILEAASPDGPLRRLMLGGERLTAALARRLQTALPLVTVTNMYGPTETCIDATAYVVSTADLPADLPIGYPLPNYTAAIYADEESVGIGVPGELCIGGAGLAREYVGKPDLTAERFVPDPLGAPGDRMYRTGDRACWRPDGSIAFLGRIDAQVKIRGFRVEPGEIEAALAGHESVVQAAVIAREGRLYGYVVLRRDAVFDAAALRAALAERLPEYMVPTGIAAITALPLTANGKLDERALPEIRLGAATLALRTSTERALARIVGEMLGAADVGADSDFFALGGHSLLATQLVARVRAELGASVPLRVVFTHPTIAGIAAHIDAAAGERPAVARKRERPAILPLSFSQEWFWMLDRLTAGDAYNIPLAFRIDGPFDPDAAARALCGIVERHEVLRSVIVPGPDDVPTQAILPPGAFVPRRVAFGDRDERELDAHLGAFAAAPFDVTRELPIRAEIVVLGHERYILAVVAHHVAFDGWSAGIFLGEFVALYEAYARGAVPGLPPVAWQYADVAVVQRDDDDVETGLAFWRAFLADAPPALDLPVDPEARASGGRSASFALEIAPALHAALATRAQQHGASLFMVLHAAFAVLLARACGERDLVIGTAVAGRSWHEWEATIGCFVNTLSLRLAVEPSERFVDVLERARDRDREAFAQQHVPFDRVARAVRADRADRADAPLVRAMLVLQNTPMPRPDLRGLSVEAVPLPVGGPKVDLTLNLTEHAGVLNSTEHAGVRGLSGAFEYDPSLFSAGTIALLTAGFLRVLEAVALDAECDVDAIDLGGLVSRPRAERRATRATTSATGIAARAYEEPHDAIERAIAEIFASVLGVERVGRSDDFFAIGGHSLLAMTAVERMRRRDLHVDIRVLFSTPTVAAIAAAVDAREAPVAVPERRIPAHCASVAPEMLPLVTLTQDEIDTIVASMPGGAANVLDIYPLAPLQEGILFRHVMERVGDTYLVPLLMSFDRRERVDRFVAALDELVARHDVLRTAFVWEGVREPVQVVLRAAHVRVEEVALEPGDGDAVERLRARYDPRSFRLDLREAPILRAFVVHDVEHERFLLLLMSHHLLLDHVSLALALDEVRALALDARERLPVPVPYRNFVAQSRGGRPQAEHEAFFRGLLGDIDEPTIPFDVAEVREGGTAISEARRRLPHALSTRLRERARILGTGPSALFHAAWAVVLARVTGRDAVVFGTVMLGRMQAGSGGDRVLGLTINTLPIRIDTEGGSVEDLVRRTRATLGDLMRHEHAPLALAQRCSAVAAPVPLFTSVFNYRFSPELSTVAQAWPGVAFLGSEERTNYPLAMAVDDTGDGFVLTAQGEPPIDPERACVYLETALDALVYAFDRSPDVPVRTLDALPPDERRTVIDDFNATTATFPSGTLHELFAAQAAATPDALAVVSETEKLTYAVLAGRAHALARELVARGVRPHDVVGVALERSPLTIVALLGVLEAGAVYLPLDPAYPADRIAFTIDDARAAVVVTEPALHALLPDRVVTIDMRADDDAAPPPLPHVRVNAHDPAYVIYTSGSTGRPKGVVVAHAAAVNLAYARRAHDPIGPGDRILAAISVGFDVSIGQLVLPLLAGATVVVAPDLRTLAPTEFWAFLARHGVTHINSVPSYFDSVVEAAPSEVSLQRLMLGGEALSSSLVRRLRAALPETETFNMYGPTEACIDATCYRATDAPDGGVLPIGRPLPNYRAYVLDRFHRPVPIGVAGELFLGGAGLAIGYLHRPELTAERFVRDPFGGPHERLYATGDRARFRSDGTLDFLGRSDAQVKIRGFRVELGEVEAALGLHPEVASSAVVARDGNLYGYVTAIDGATPSVAALRTFIADTLPAYMRPAAIAVLSELPITVNGKVDYHALPELRSAAGATEPRDHHEALLQLVWQDVLGIETIGVDDDFFALGGHSLLAMRLVAACGEAVGQSLPLRLILETPTIAGMAAALRSGIVANTRGLVRLRRGETDGALVCVHPAFGHAVGYGALAKAYPGMGAVYGIQASGLEPGESLGSDVVSMATDYLDVIRTVLPSGPYRLLGFSSGGLVAFEMARQLSAAGAPVAMLALLDTTPPGGADALREETDLEVWFEMAGALGWDVSGFPAHAFASRDALIAVAVERALLQGELAVEHVRRMMTVRRNNVRASVAYRAGSWRGRAVVVRSLRRQGTPLPDWSQLIAPPPATIDIDCAHDDLISPDMGETVMAHLAPYFARA